MRIPDLLHASNTHLHTHAADKEGVIDLLVELQTRAAAFPTKGLTKRPFWPVRLRTAPPSKRALRCPMPE